ncbi:MAG: PAS domain-containing protein, partial [Cryomorphaceae bacterium]
QLSGVEISVAFEGIHFIVVNDDESLVHRTAAVEKELTMFFNNSIFGAFFMTADQPVPWHEDADREAALEYLLTHLRVTRINQAMLDQYGASRADFIGRTPRDFFKHDLEQERKLLWDIFDKGKHRAVSFELNEAGENVIFEGDYEVLRNENNDIIGIFGLQQDITKRYRYIEEIESQNARLREIARFQSHTVRSPLSRMLSILAVYESDAFTPEERSEFLGYMRLAAAELDGIIGKIVERSDGVGRTEAS